LSRVFMPILRGEILPGYAIVFGCQKGDKCRNQGLSGVSASLRHGIALQALGQVALLLLLVD
jgi:hypothetical protein